MPEITEQNLIESAISGDLESFGLLCRDYYSAVTAVAYSVLGEHQSAEDAAQETFARALVNLRKLKDTSRFGCWLASIWRNVARDMLTEKNKPLKKEALLQNNQAEKTDSVAEPVRMAIEKLPIAMKEIVILRYYDSLSYEKISSVLGISKASINGRLTRAKRKMASYLKNNGFPENRL